MFSWDSLFQLMGVPRLIGFKGKMTTASHPEGVVNIANGLVSTNNVNVDKALELGQHQMDEFETGWPSSFHKTLKKNVITMPNAKKSIKIEGTPVYDTELLYSRIIGLQQSRELDIRDILAYELSAVPSALFDEYGNMRSSSKALLKCQSGEQAPMMQ